MRAYNCLKRAGITKVGEILKRMEKGEDEMLAIRNFGKKSLDELVEKLRDKNYLTVPGVDLSAYMSGTYRTASEVRRRRRGIKARSSWSCDIELLDAIWGGIPRNVRRSSATWCGNCICTSGSSRRKPRRARFGRMPRS